MIAGAVAALASGTPSTLHALIYGRSPLESSYAAGSLLLPREERPHRLLAAAVPVHVALSVAWALPLAAFLPRRHTLLAGGAAGAAIAAVDFGLIGRRLGRSRRFRRIRELPLLPQIADHAAYGAIVAAVVATRRARRASAAAL